MEIRLSRESDFPLRRQLAEQIIFLISVGKLRSGQLLPSVRGLARRLKIHHNTVSEAYQDLVRRTWVARQRGSRLVVGSSAIPSGSTASKGVDEFINAAIRRAREEGYTLQQLRECVRERLLSQAPDHVLVIERDPGLREIMRQEIRQALGWPVQTCSREELAKVPGLAIRAQVATPEYAIDDIEPLVPKDRPAVSITFSGADGHVELIRTLREPSVIGVVSVSEALLRTARGLLAPALGERHTFREFLLSRKGKADLRAVDVAFCDSLAMPVVRCRRKIHYRLIAPGCLEDLVATFEPSAWVNLPLIGRESQRRIPSKSHALASRRLRRSTSGKLHSRSD
jgi:DNA-binding transcriptional regulator YhcF (GntR family)